MMQRECPSRIANYSKIANKRNNMERPRPFVNSREGRREGGREGGRGGGERVCCSLGRGVCRGEERGKEGGGGKGRC